MNYHFVGNPLNLGPHFSKVSPGCTPSAPHSPGDLCHVVPPVLRREHHPAQRRTIKGEKLAAILTEIQSGALSGTLFAGNEGREAYGAMSIRFEGV